MYKVNKNYKNIITFSFLVESEFFTVIPSISVFSKFISIMSSGLLSLLSSFFGVCKSLSLSLFFFFFDFAFFLGVSTIGTTSLSSDSLFSFSPSILLSIIRPKGSVSGIINTSSFVSIIYIIYN